MNKKHVLIVDDEPDIRELLEITLGRMNIETKSAENLAQAQSLLTQHRFDLCLTDMQLPDGNGIELVKSIQDNFSQIPVAVITAFGSVDTAISALKSGAFDFVSKPVDLPHLRNLIETALKLTDKIQPAQATSCSPILGNSSSISALRDKIEKLSRSQAPVYIWGESGSGKELVARQIHELGPRKDQAFIAVNCGAIPSELMEAEFFGHKKGSYTGAHEDKKGLFQAADKGTLFLDEVADLPLNMQVKLLRAIQEKSIRPIGSQHEIPVDIRILSATHKNLQIEVNENRFRQDLFYRINVIQLTVAPLRERKDDIPLLIHEFLSRIARQNGVQAPEIDTSALAALQHFNFPGNIRELENILERALTLSDGENIRAEHLQLNSDGINAATTDAVKDKTLSYSPDIGEGESLEDHLVEVEKLAILKALEETRWNRTAAAKKLGMSFRSLRYRLKKLGLDQVP
ncbi:MAG: sigma-54 dependent transcriptional regulator [Gammaproteobacteria bacterium]|nr:sigma-54 dependent transcriptional regulator [Gammaproteobacteria bacterium]